MKAAVFTLGCKVNQYESLAIAKLLTEYGFETAVGLAFADLFVVNTCSVTGEADKKSRQAISRALNLNPNAKIIVLGCSSQNDAEPFLSHEGVIAAGGTSDKLKFVENTINSGIMSDVIPHLVGNPQQTVSTVSDITQHIVGEKSRGLLKIQDGCDRFCSYCRVPYLRGRSTSRPEQSVLQEFGLFKNHKEIILTGVDMSAYGKDIGTDLASLISQMKGDARKRISSLECGIIDKKLLEAMQENNFCDHFHLSLQSGSGTVLKRMNRKYSAQEYYEKVCLIREYFPFAGITTDVIAGFSGETDAEHLETVGFIKKVEFADIHVFPFSRRKGTKAYNMPDLMPQIKRERAAELAEIKAKLKENFIKKNLGRVLEVFVTGGENKTDFNIGFTSNYIKVYTNAEAMTLARLKLTKIHKDGVIGEHE